MRNLSPVLQTPRDTRSSHLLLSPQDAEPFTSRATPALVPCMKVQGSADSDVACLLLSTSTCVTGQDRDGFPEMTAHCHLSWERARGNGTCPPALLVSYALAGQVENGEDHVLQERYKT